MSKVLDARAPIPALSKGITINHGDKNKVLYTIYSSYDPGVGYSKSSRVVIGVAVDEHTLIPNSNYGKYFPELWKTVSNQDVPPVTKSAGLYALVDAVGQSTGLTEILEKTFGFTRMNAVLDYVMYSIGYHSNVAMNYHATMTDHVVFSKSVHDDEYYSHLFTHEITETEINLFRIKWAQKCAAAGIKDVYLAIDGSNDDCESKGIDLAEKGAAKSHTNSDVVGFMYAVDPTCGKVVTFDTYRGGLVDSKAILRVITFLKENGIAVKGVIIDRGFCDGKCLAYLRSLKIPYVLMMKGATAGHQYMMAMHSDELRWNPDCWIPGTLLFATSDTWKLFDTSEISGHLHLYYDFKNGDERCETLIRKINKLIRQVKSGQKNVEIPADLKNIISLRQDGNGKEPYILQGNAFRTELDTKGYYTIATSETMTSQEAHEMYSSRNIAEVEFDYVKTELGYGTVRVQSEPCVRSRFMVGVLCAIVREEIENACKELELKTNTMVQELRRLSIACLNTKNYTMIHTEKRTVLQLLKKLDITAEDLNEIAANETRKMNGELPVIRKKKPGPKKGSHHQRFDTDGNPIKSKPGPKPGSHHKVKYNKDGSVRKKPGPKPGSHHKKKVETIG